MERLTKDEACTIEWLLMWESMRLGQLAPLDERHAEEIRTTCEWIAELRAKVARMSAAVAS